MFAATSLRVMPARGSSARRSSGPAPVSEKLNGYSEPNATRKTIAASSQPATRRSFWITRSPEADRAPQGQDFLAAQRAEMTARQAPELE